MFSFPLCKQTVKSNYKIWLIITGVLCMYIAIIAAVITPDLINQMNTMYKQMGTSASLTGFTDLTSVLANDFYGMMGILFPMIYTMIVANRLIAGSIDRGTMAYTLSCGIKRTKVTLTYAIYLIASLAAMFTVTTVVGIAIASIAQPGQLNIGVFILINVGCFLLELAIASICFVSSCIFNLSKFSLAFGAGIPIAFFVCTMLESISSNLSFLKYCTINTLFNTSGILAGENYIWQFIVLGVIAIILFAFGIVYFKEKDLPL